VGSEKIYIHHFSVMAPAAIIERTMQFYRDVLGVAPGHRPEFSLPGYWLSLILTTVKMYNQAFNVDS
jgi:catechol 2,3-dioxygenase-like lactoylglutathione lyase family enzyme